MSAEQQVLVVKDKVARYLGELVGPIQMTPDGAYSFRQGSAQAFVSCHALGDRWTAVRIDVSVLFSVPASDELYRHVAMHSRDYVFGSLLLVPSRVAEGTLDLIISHSLLGDYLDKEELNIAVASMASVADQLDNQLQGQFGGRRYHEDDA